MPDINIKKPFITQDRPKVYQNLAVEGFLLLVAVILLVNFLVLPKKHEAASAREKYNQLLSQSNSLEQKTQEMNQLISQMKAAKKDINVLDSAMPLSARITTTHVLLDNLVASSGLTLANLNADSNINVIAAGDQKLAENPFAEARQLQAVTVNLNLTGTMDQFLSFLKALENSARIVDVTSLEITGNKNNLAAFKLVLKTYFYGPAPSEAVAPQQ